jgi:hypothetical protein
METGSLGVEFLLVLRKCCPERLLATERDSAAPFPRPAQEQPSKRTMAIVVSLLEDSLEALAASARRQETLADLIELRLGDKRFKGPLSTPSPSP